MIPKLMDQMVAISIKMLKGTTRSIAPVLTRLFNKFLETGVFPDKWKQSSVVPTVTVLIKAPLKTNHGPPGALTLEWLRGLRGALFGEVPFNWSRKFAFVT